MPCPCWTQGLPAPPASVRGNAPTDDSPGQRPGQRRKKEVLGALKGRSNPIRGTQTAKGQDICLRGVARSTGRCPVPMAPLQGRAALDRFATGGPDTGTNTVASNLPSECQSKHQ